MSAATIVNTVKLLQMFQTPFWPNFLSALSRPLPLSHIVGYNNLRVVAAFHDAFLSQKKWNSETLLA